MNLFSIARHRGCLKTEAGDFLKLSKVPADWSSSLKCFGSFFSTFILFFFGGESSHLLFTDYIVYDAKTSLMYWMGCRFLRVESKTWPSLNFTNRTKKKLRPSFNPPKFQEKFVSTSTDFLRGMEIFTCCSFVSKWRVSHHRPQRSALRAGFILPRELDATVKTLQVGDLVFWPNQQVEVIFSNWGK